MERADIFELERKIGHWRFVLSRLEKDMNKMQSERDEVKTRLVYLHRLQKQVGFAA